MCSPRRSHLPTEWAVILDILIRKWRIKYKFWGFWGSCIIYIFRLFPICSEVRFLIFKFLIASHLQQLIFSMVFPSPSYGDATSITHRHSPCVCDDKRTTTFFILLFIYIDRNYNFTTLCHGSLSVSFRSLDCRFPWPSIQPRPRPINHCGGDDGNACHFNFFPANFSNMSLNTDKQKKWCQSWTDFVPLEMMLSCCCWNSIFNPSRLGGGWVVCIRTGEV